MKLLNKKISRISKSVLLYSLLIGGLHANELVSSDRFLLKIYDKTISLLDVTFQLRNLKALDCVYDNALVIQYFEKGFIKDLDNFIKTFPKDDESARRHLHGNEALLKKLRHFFKMLRYSEDQKTEVTPNLAKIIREGTLENKCGEAVLYKDSLKTNFIGLLEMELYLRARYGNQLKGKSNFETIRPSVELFVDSLDKQFGHEYYW